MGTESALGVSGVNGEEGTWARGTRDPGIRRLRRHLWPRSERWERWRHELSHAVMRSTCRWGMCLASEQVEFELESGGEFGVQLGI